MADSSFEIGSRPPSRRSSSTRSHSSASTRTPKSSSTASSRSGAGGRTKSTGSSRTSVSRYGKAGGRRKGGSSAASGPGAQHLSSVDKKRLRQIERRPAAQVELKRDNRARAKLSIPEPKDNIRIIPLGGVEEIGMNMTVIEYKDDIVVVDMGFAFERESTPGVDYILPNTEYLEERKDKIRAVFITHGHLDHIGGIPYIMDKIGNPPLYSRLLTTVMIKKRQEEFPDKPALDIRTVEGNDVITAGSLKVRFFNVTHTIPEAMGIIIETPHGWIVNMGDVKLDHKEGVPSEAEEEAYSVFKDNKVLLMIADSTNVERPGWSLPEWLVHENLEKIIGGVKGRLIIGTFASQIDRIIAIIGFAEKHGKKVIIEGRSMKQNIEIIKQLNLLKPKPGTFITGDQMDQYPPDRIVVLATGAQGDDFAALMRMSTKQHKHIKLSPRDTILLSSSIIPGNENAVQRLKDNLARQGVKIIHYRESPVHASGHGYQEEIAWMHRKIRPKFFMPVHGHHYMLRVHASLAERLGVKPENIVIPDNGSIIEISADGEKIAPLKAMAPNDTVLVDGFSVGTIKEVVLRDRDALANDGMFVIVASINPKNGKLRKSPDIISRGFVYLRESQDMLRKTRTIIKRTIEQSTRGQYPIDFDKLKDNVTDEVGRFLLQQTAKRPIIIPVIIGV